jgi:hypothetical protein
MVFEGHGLKPWGSGWTSTHVPRTMARMEPRYRDKGAVDRDDAVVEAVAIPALRPQQLKDSGAPIVLDVDGEVFELRPDGFGGTGYSWLTGPNVGYGFGTSPTLGWSVDDHRTNIRWFITQIDPATGYIEDN